MLHLNWQVKRKVPAAWVRQAADAFEKKFKTNKKQLSVAIVGRAASSRLNKKYRGKDRATNVLSFPLAEQNFLGEIILCLPVIRNEAKKQNQPLKKYFQYIFVHGLLHLVGFDHQTNRQANDMEKEEQRLLKSL